MVVTASAGIVARSMTERDFQRHVLMMAKALGWAAYHPYDSRRSEAGWPDLALVKPGRLLLVELKTEAGRVSASQTYWLGLLRTTSAEVYLWRPSGLWNGGIEAVLRGA